MAIENSVIWWLRCEPARAELKTTKKKWLCKTSCFHRLPITTKQACRHTRRRQRWCGRVGQASARLQPQLRQRP